MKEVILKLTDWEIANFHLKPVTTLTFFEGEASIEFLQSRLAMLLTKNPWLTSRIIKEENKKAVPAMVYTPGFEVEQIIEDYFKIYDSNEVTIQLDQSYESIVESTLPYGCVDSKKAIIADEVLFKLSVIPISNTDGNGPLQNIISENGYVLVVSMNHTLGDGHTYYKLFNMLSEGAEVESLDPVRKDGFEEEKTKIVGAAENGMLTSVGNLLGIVGNYLLFKIFKRPPQNVLIYEVDASWISSEKLKTTSDGLVPFISGNDALTSWFFKTMKTDISLMVANFRSRKPAILDLNDQHVGNYEANIPYFPQDVKSPSLIRQFLTTSNGEFQARRSAIPPTKIPGFWKLLKNKASIVTNWSSFQSELKIRNRAGETIEPRLHLPIM